MLEEEKKKKHQPAKISDQFADLKRELATVRISTDLAESQLINIILSARRSLRISGIASQRSAIIL
jgi:hypothetical protein